MERGRIEGLPKFFAYHLLSQEWIKLRTGCLCDSKAFLYLSTVVIFMGAGRGGQGAQAPTLEKIRVVLIRPGHGGK